MDSVAVFFGGMLLTNGVPHYVAGLMGRPFHSPFASPPGVGLSSPISNVVWGAFSFVLGYLCVYRGCSEKLDLFGNPYHAMAFGAGSLAVSLVLSVQFGSFSAGVR
jgi:hypothetical protein